MHLTQKIIHYECDDLATDSVIWLERADVTCICSPYPTVVLLPPFPSLTQIFSHGLTQLHNQQQDHAQHITSLGNESEWANHSSHLLCMVSCGIMEEKKCIFSTTGKRKRLREKEKRTMFFIKLRGSILKHIWWQMN